MQTARDPSPIHPPLSSPDPLARFRDDRWRLASRAAEADGPPLPDTARPGLVELFPDRPLDAGALGLALSALAPGLGERPLLWVLDAAVARQVGRPCLYGLAEWGLSNLLLVCPRDARSALWAMEEALSCDVIGAIVGELWGNPRALDFTASRRLAVAAERRGVPVVLLRPGAGADLSAARARWRVASSPSAFNPFNADAPGHPRWTAELFRARGHRPGSWRAEWGKRDLISARRLRLDGATRGGADATLSNSTACDPCFAWPTWTGKARAQSTSFGMKRS